MKKLFAVAALAACCALGACQSSPSAEAKTMNGEAKTCTEGKACGSEAKSGSCGEKGEAKSGSCGEAGEAKSCGDKGEAKAGCCGGSAEAKASKEASGGKCCGSCQK